MSEVLVLWAGAVTFLVAARVRPRSAGRRGRPGRPLGPGVRLAAMAAGALVAVVAAGIVGLVVGGLVAVLVPPLARRRRRLRVAAARLAAVPELVELFVVAASAGLPVAVALEAVAGRSPQPLRADVRAASGRFDQGVPLLECLADLGRSLGPAGGPLVAALTTSATSGAPLADRLAAVAERSRDVRRQRALEAARRLPVTMLFPLVGCVLPAAVVLAVAPVVAVSLSSLAS